MTPSARSRTRPYSMVLIGALAILGFAPLDRTILYLLAIAMAWAIAAVGLDLFSGYLGQPSFGQGAFVGIGAYGVTVFRTELDLPFIVAALLALVIVGGIATLVGVALVRLRDFGLVLGTFFLAYVVANLLSGTTLAVLTHSGSGLVMPPLAVGSLTFSSGRAFYYLSLVLLLLALLITSNYTDSRAGRALRVVKRSEVVAEVLGIPCQLVKLQALVYAAVLAGIAGILLATGVGFIAPESFSPSQSIVLFAMAAVGGLGSVAGPVLGALLFTITPNFLEGAKSLQGILFAAILLVSLIFFRDGFYGLLEGAAHHGRQRWPRRLHRAEDAPALAHVPGARVRTRIARHDLMTDCANIQQPALEIRDLQVSFAGVRALDRVSLDLRPREVHALIGPNGAGKTTLLNCITGVERTWQGHLTILGQMADRWRPSRIRELGVTRTFQHPSLVPDLSTVENVKLGLYADETWSLWRDLLGLARNRERKVEHFALQALEFAGVAPSRFDVQAKHLSLAEQKLVDIARAAVAQGSLLIMDEPTAGLTGEEMDVVADVIRHLRAKSTVAVLLVSHHVGFVKEVAQAVTVLASGRVIARGSPADVTWNPVVREAFLGYAATDKEMTEDDKVTSLS